MSGTSVNLAAEGGGVSLSGSNVTFVIVALVFALIALGFAAMFVHLNSGGTASRTLGSSRVRAIPISSPRRIAAASWASNKIERE